MRLAREDDLHGPPGGVQDRLQPLRIVKDQLGALVAGEATRESDRERIGIEQRAGHDDARSGDMLIAPALASALADEGEQVLAKCTARDPERLVGDIEDSRPRPSDRRDGRASPAGRYSSNRRVSSCEIHVGMWMPLVIARTGRWSSAVPGQIGPHISRVTLPCSWLTAFTPFAVRSASAVMLNCGPLPLSYAPSCEKALAVLAERAPAAREMRLDKAEREGVVPSRDRRVGREDRRAADFLQRGVEGLSRSIMSRIR